VPSTGHNRLVPPEPEELEVSIFGPGYGESIVLHLGLGDWGVVDSCIDPDSKRPAALHYLESLGVNLGRAVRFVVATHWHDDHIQGLDEVFRRAAEVVFSCTEAVRAADFVGILAVWQGTRFLAGGSGIDELHGILLELKSRQTRTRFPSPRYASTTKVLWERASEISAKVKALSPSDATVIASAARIATVIPTTSKARRRLPNVEPNDASVVLSVQIAQHQILLGSDLRAREDRGVGWLAVVDNMEAGAERHEVFKVAHHGSQNGDHDELWGRMLLPDAWAATTPFVSGKVRLPSVDDCKRILRRTHNAYLTAPPQPAKFRDPNRTVEKTVNEATLWAQMVPGKFGHVRFRKLISESARSPWHVELFGYALSMEEYERASH
jgi:hypothetical protein